MKKSYRKSQRKNNVKSGRHNVFTKEINKIPLSSNDDKRVQLNDSVEPYAYRTKNDLIRKKQKIKCRNIKL